LFPIQLRPYDPAWEQWYETEATHLRSAFTGDAVEITHIGSTSVPGLMAKPIVDILVETDDQRGPAAIVSALVDQGWLLMAASDDPRFRLDLNKGYTPDGFADKVFHCHVVRPGDRDEVYFRDWLRTHPRTCREYEALKRDLASKHEHDRDAYTLGKTQFIRAITGQAIAAGSSRHH
jgi:GrpB-like predicted nucleotidyltransferase (UPF0157 family)